MDAALSIENLVKTYGPRRAVDGLSFAAPRGEIFGVLGPNGAGKSSTLRMIVGILRPTSGRVLLNGAPPSYAALKRVGYLPEERGLYKAMTARAAITYFARLKGTPAKEARRRADALLEAHGLGAVAGKKIKTFSKGMAQKVQILSTIAHKPDIVILDEPFSGLDPVNQASLEALVRELAADGCTVLFSTHVMEHAERMCDRVVLIANGRKAFEGSVSEALAEVARSAEVETDGPFELGMALAPLGFPTILIEGARPGARRWRVELDGSADAAQRCLAACVAAGAPLTAFEPARATLHDAFVKLVAQAPGLDAAAFTPGWRGGDA